MSDVRYTKEHEWIRLEGEVGVVGITDYAQNALGDVVYVEVPEAGKALKAGGEAGVIESVKAASEIYSPVTGEVVEGNGALEADPALVNSSPQGEGWIFKVKLANPGDVDALMTEEDYKAFVDGLD
ncbi:glycine cleavage system protein GcvH [Iodidimonas sp. SYSU 1G8]|uniref:glycine cleavage system protein GcvH n=1 Tax=Iodidimonas sp. SYSU 1G8 TaxID=3133967 RepID=UPI0031FEDED6